jgi:hypothetical protein
MSAQVRPLIGVQPPVGIEPTTFSRRARFQYSEGAHRHVQERASARLVMDAKVNCGALGGTRGAHDLSASGMASGQMLGSSAVSSSRVPSVWFTPSLEELAWCRLLRCPVPSSDQRGLRRPQKTNTRSSCESTRSAVGPRRSAYPGVVRLRCLLISSVIFGSMATVAVALPGVAQTRYQADPRGDASRASFDLTHVTYVNESSLVSVKARLVNLKPRRAAFGFNLYEAGTPGSTGYYYGITTRHSDGSVTASLQDQSGRVRCDIRGRWRVARDTVRIAFPQQCLQQHHAFRIQVFVGDPRDGDPDDFASTVRVLLN